MTGLIALPEGGEWLVVLAIVVLLFGPAKLPGLVRQLARSKKVWDDETKPARKLPQEHPQEEQPPADSKNETPQ
ncbi:sec-independent protein translocase protein TatA [Kribbella amoyensis]|uniref:Sec-independent protein translocase protein TatA n=1 Tax=Kribbella amoyensis TaxID=996641 RepID=A0A561BSF0_9ACTN|nr:twin-arginine translocase TatA/TatE family subunit [Kribbella amoyensis]TWD81712.1 sec-independent protein translocase protein TatA [Kribbella amoyensis]